MAEIFTEENRIVESSGVKLSQKERVDKYCTVFNDDTKNLERLTAKKSMDSLGWNKHLNVPLKGSEKVFVHPDQSDIREQYVRIIHSKYKVVAVFSKHDFIEYSPNEKDDED